MKKYILHASEIVYYQLEVEAESEAEARDLLYQGQVAFDHSDITDYEDFNLNRVEEIKQ
jgi:hypothetical protein